MDLRVFNSFNLLLLQVLVNLMPFSACKTVFLVQFWCLGNEKTSVEYPQILRGSISGHSNKRDCAEHCGTVEWMLTKGMSCHKPIEFPRPPQEKGCGTGRGGSFPVCLNVLATPGLP